MSGFFTICKKIWIEFKRSCRLIFDRVYYITPSKNIFNSKAVLYWHDIPVASTH